MSEENGSVVSRYWHIGILTLLVILAAVIRLKGLSEWYWSPDDALFITYAGQDSISDVLRTVLTENTHTPAFFMLLHAMLQISDHPLWLRCISLIPGMLLILAMYALGYTYKGRVAGLVMAFLTCFNMQWILLAQAVRQYSLLCLALTLGLMLLLRAREHPSYRQITGYGLCMLAALMVHHSAVIPIAVIGVGYFVVLVRRSDFRYAAYYALWHLLLAAVFVSIYAIQHVYNPFHAVDVAHAVHEWLRSGFPDSQRWYLWFLNLFAVLAINPAPYDPSALSVIIYLLLFCSGVARLIEQKDGFILWLVFGMVAMNMLFAFWRLAPFISDRHTVYLFPVIMLPVACAVQNGWSYLQAALVRRSVSGNGNEQQKRGLRYDNIGYKVVLNGVFIVVFWCMFALFSSAIDLPLRRETSEFVISVKEYQRFETLLRRQEMSEEIVVLDTQTLILLGCALEKRSRVLPESVVRRVWCRGRLFYVSDREPKNIITVFYHVDEIQAFLADLDKERWVGQRHRVWFATLGWNNLMTLLHFPPLIARKQTPFHLRPENRPLSLEYQAALGLAWELQPLLVGQERHIFGLPHKEGGKGVLFSVPWDGMKSVFLKPERVAYFQALKRKREALWVQ